MPLTHKRARFFYICGLVISDVLSVHLTVAHVKIEVPQLGMEPAAVRR